MNVALIGMAGAGKSYIGEKVAEKLGLQCIDIDREMERDVGMSLQEILDNLGDAAFIEAESIALINRTQGDNLLISPGGSIVQSERAMQHLRNTARIVFLNVPFETIEERVKDSARGIVGLKEKTLREIYDERFPLYKRYAHIAIDTSGKTADDIVAEITCGILAA